jgi:hypothetical protein
MAEFRSWQSYQTFAWNVKRQASYVFSEETEGFLKTVIVTSESRKKIMPQGRILWRAQLGHAWRKCQQEDDQFEVPAPFLPERMKPLRYTAREGRVNAKGLSCLYLANHRKTAMAEIRPWIGSYISVGQFRTLRELTVLDCSIFYTNNSVFYFDEPDAVQREKAVWADIGQCYSEPVTPDDQTPDYVPTQILSEVFRDHGYDGVVYKSLVGEGLNLALFDIDSADMLKCFLYRVKTAVEFDFDEIEDSYISEKYRKKSE